MAMATKQMTAQERYDHMKQSILEGGGVLHQGRTITRVDDLPSLGDLAVTEVEKTQALADLEDRRRRLNEEEARLRAGSPLGSSDNVNISGPGAAGEESGKGGGKKAGSGPKDAANEPATQPQQK